jgi:DNA helicase II / ATP-dependent DNA helicase PcrA
LSSSNNSVLQIRESLFNGLSKSLKLGGILNPVNQRPFTTSTLTKYLAEHKTDFWVAMRLKVALWLKQLAIGKIDCREEITKYATTDFWQVWGKEMNNECKAFFTTNLANTNQEDVPKVLSKNNCFDFEKDGITIPVNFSTIHSVKGETHCATLYLETFNRTFDIEKIIPFILGEKKQTIRNSNLGRLKTSYVAMTRATHLVCLAVREKVITDKIDELKNAGWRVEVLSK